MMKKGSTGHFTLPALSLRKEGALLKLILGEELERRDVTPPSYSRVALARQGVTLQARRQGDVGDDGAAAATLQAHLGGFGFDCRCRDDDAVHLHQTRHLLRLQGTEKTRKSVINLSVTPTV